MKKISLIVAAGLFALSLAAAETNSMPESAEAKYTAAIEGRTADILKALALTDADKAAKVHDAILAQYRALNAWHNENDAKLKASAKDTTAPQVEAVKDKMTYNKVKVTYDAYCEIIPTLTGAQKAHILATLKAAREEAMDGGSADEKSAIFKKYKGRIANYLSKEGVDETKARKEWGAKQKEKSAAAAEIKTNALVK